MSNSHPTEPSPPDPRVFVFAQVAEEEQRETQPGQEIAKEPVLTASSSSSSSGEKYLTQAADKSVAGVGSVAVTLPEELLAEQSVRDQAGQSIYLPNDDLLLSLHFHHRSSLRRVSWYAACIASLGVLYVVAHWYPRVWLRWNGKRTTLQKACETLRSGQLWIAVKTRHDPLQLCRVRRKSLPDPTSASLVFPPSMKVPASSSTMQTSTPDGDLGTQTVSEYLHFDYRSTAFILHPSGAFIPLADWRDPDWSSKETLIDGPLPSKRRLLESIFGPNLIDIQGKSVGTILLHEVLHPFYIFMVYSIVLWGVDDYLPYAIVIMVISILGIASTTVETKRAVVRLRNMSRFVCAVQLWSRPEQGAGEWVERDSTVLVPGDVINIAAMGTAKLETLPCDCVLLEGDAIVSEALLTGESVPVVKSALLNDGLASLHSPATTTKLDRHLLFGGTRLVRARVQDEANGGVVRAMVVKTGFNTCKGSLIRQMLFPRQIKFKFLRDAFMAIGVLFLLAFMGLIASVIYFVHIGVDPTEIALRSLDVLTISVPPALPAALSVATTFAIARLKRRKIFCTSPQRINVAGMITAVVFDKTGTLTEEGLSVLGVCEMRDGKAFGETTKEFESMQSDAGAVNLQEALATTHDVNMFQYKLLGEPLEVAMVAWTGAELQEDEVAVELGAGQGPALTRDRKQASVPTVTRGGKRVAVVSKHDFSSDLRRMSVVVKGESDTGAQVYVKGAPEVIGALCHADSFPSNYAESLDAWTRGGYRVIGLAGKRVEGRQWSALVGMERAEVESGLTFLGLLIFENRLKVGSRDTIQLLNEGNIVTKMCTGDAPLTAIAVARESRLVGEGWPVYMARLAGSDEKINEAGGLEWVDIADPGMRLDSYSLQPLDRHDGLQAGLCISGEAYGHALQHCAGETLDRLLVTCQVFARFSPEQKQDLVERLQGLDYSVAFAGDGANDMGGLKSADVGVSLSQAEASVAAPFTSEDICAVEQLIREGRNAVTTSCNLFNFMIIYSLCEYFTVLLLYGAPGFSTSLDNAEYIYIDVFLVFPFAIGMSASRPSSKLAGKGAHARIISRRNLLSVLSQFVLLVLAQVTVYVVLHKQDFYVPPDNDPEDLDLHTQDNTVLFKTSIFAYLYAAIIWNYGPPHRQVPYRNYLLTLAIVVLTTLNLFFLFTTGGPLFDLFGLQESVPKRFYWIIFGVIAAQFLVALASELCLVDNLAQLLKKPTRALQRWYREKVQKKPYKSSEKRYRLVGDAIMRDAAVSK